MTLPVLSLATCTHLSGYVFEVVFLLASSSTVRLSCSLGVLNVDIADGLRPLSLGEIKSAQGFSKAALLTFLGPDSSFFGEDGCCPMRIYQYSWPWRTRCQKKAFRAKIVSRLRTTGLEVYITCKQDSCCLFVCWFNGVQKSLTWRESVVLSCEFLP